ncbi:peptidylprolyl isomerase [Sinomonas halotolerans]|uniref:Peptidylprolyl isomerase n=1 Tax=Sinomonas halotolerans TaxID=1644133 RepID=A0ABU9WZJ2_9MICC
MKAKAELRDRQAQRRRRDNVIASAVTTGAIVVAAVLQGTAFASNPTAAEYAAAAAGLETPSPAPSATNAPGVPAAETAAGKKFTGTLVLNGKKVGVALDGAKAPQAAAVFSSLAREGTLEGRTCHRLTTAAAMGILQCGAQDASGASDPSYTWGPLENTPADGVYPAGAIAVARTGNNAYGNGQQFFIVYRKSTIPTDEAGGYTVVGSVTSGLQTVKEIADRGVASGEDGAPVTPVTIDSFTVE